jgi:predicted RNA-binding Zn-ribbon protein involved in translation (DUF1610 family)
MTQPISSPNAGASGAATSTADPAAGPDSATAAARVEVPKQVTCPVCQTTFAPRATGGRCPVCGEQMIAADDLAHPTPVATPVSQWLKSGGWRVVALLALVAYQIGLFLFVLIHMKSIGAP